MKSWVNFGKNASGTAAKAVHQAKVMSEVAKINGLVADEKKKMDDVYFQLGQKYVELHHDDYEPEFEELMTALINAEQSINQYQTQIQTLKGVTICATCNAEIAKGSAFCNNCGTPVPCKQTESELVCSNCGKILSENVRFCTHCGTPVVKSEPEVIVHVEEAPVCPNCGAELDSDSVFCAECGTKVKES